MASVPTTASTLAKTNARVTNFRKHSAHMVLVCTQTTPTWRPPSPPFPALLSRLLLQKTQNLLPSQLRRGCAKRTALIEVLKVARKGNGWFLKYGSKLGCHLNEGVQQMLSANPTNRSLYFTLTPRSGAWPPPKYYYAPEGAAIISRDAKLLHQTAGCKSKQRRARLSRSRQSRRLCTECKIDGKSYAIAVEENRIWRDLNPPSINLVYPPPSVRKTTIPTGAASKIK